MFALQMGAASGTLMLGALMDKLRPVTMSLLIYSGMLASLLALGTVCVVSVVFGLDSIFTFSFPLIIGMISGVYSSVCIAGPLWVAWEKRVGVKARKR